MKTPSECFAADVEPAYHDFLQDRTERRANQAAYAVNKHVEWCHQYYLAAKHPMLCGTTGLKEFRAHWFAQCPALRTMYDLADADKHRKLTWKRENRIVTTSTDAYVVEDDRLFVAGYGRFFDDVLDEAVNFLCGWGN